MTTGPTPSAGGLADQNEIQARAIHQSTEAQMVAFVCKNSLHEFVREFWSVVEPMPFVDNWHVQVLAEHLEAVTRGNIKRLVINIPPGFGKPVDEDTLVLTGSGASVPLKSIRVGDYVINKMGERTQVTAVHKQGELDCLEITTFSGRKVVAAPDHPFLTPDGWKVASDLTVGRCLALMSEPMTIPSKNHRDEEFALAGYFVGDGSVTWSVPNVTCAATITSADLDYRQEIARCAEVLGFSAREYGNPGDKVKRINLSGGVREWLKDIGLAGKNSYTKEVPEFVFEGDQKQIGRYLAAYFHCDGTINKKSSDRKRVVISFSSVSRELLSGTQRLLLRLGIYSRIRRREQKNNKYAKNSGGHYVYYCLDLSTQDDAAKFLQRVPLLGRKLDRLVGHSSYRSSFDAEYLPDEIVGIRSVGKRRCRCLSVSVGRSFVASDFVVHNSLIVSVLWPAWAWASNPKLRYFCASYDQKLSTRDSVRMRALVESDRYRELFGHYKIVRGADLKTYYETDQGGWRLATSVGGHGTGEHPDTIIVDDAHSAQQAESEVERQAVTDWWDLTMSSRGMVRDVRRVIVMQRLHVRDLSGHVLAKGDFVHVCLPMRYEPDRACITPLGRVDPRTEEGELLMPQLFTEEIVQGLEKSLTVYGVAGQLQQRPAPKGGGMFQVEYFNNRVKAAPYDCTRIRFTDRAATAAGGCYSASVLMARSKTNPPVFYVEHVFRGQWEPRVRNQKIIAAAHRDRAKYGSHEPLHVIEAERGSTGLESFQNLAAMMAGFRVREDIPSGSKDTRAEPLADQCAAGNIVIVEDGSWDVAAFVDELVSFRPQPGKRIGGFVDQVDAACLLAGSLISTNRGLVPIEEVVPGDEVKTRRGYRRVIWSGQSGTVSHLVSVFFSNGTHLTGTFEHLVWTLDRGYIRLGDLDGSDRVLLDEEFPCLRTSLGIVTSADDLTEERSSQSAAPRSARRSGVGIRRDGSTSTRRLSFGESSSADRYTSRTLLVGGTTSRSLSIGSSGCVNTAASPLAMTFIIGMKTHSTTYLRTWSALARRSIDRHIGSLTELLNNSPISKEFGSLLKSGTPLMRDVSGTASMERECSRQGSLGNSSALTVGRSSCLRATERRGAAFDTAQQGVEKGSDKRLGGSLHTREPALHARGSFSPRGRRRSAALESAGRSTGGLIPVYDLTVEDAHEFFANGVLVHNSGAFNLLAGTKFTTGIRVVTFASSKKQGFKVVVCTSETLPSLVLDHHHSLLVSLSDPDPLGTEELPTHGLTRLAGTLKLRFACLSPADYQDRWEEPLPDYQKPPAEVIMTRDHGKKLWGFLLKKRDFAPQIFVLHDDNLDRGLSLACAVCDGLGFRKEQTIYLAGEPHMIEKPPVPYVYETAKASRSMVI